MSLVWSFVLAAGKWLLGMITTPKDPTSTELAASNATAQTELAQERTANAVTSEAAAARAAADVAVVRDLTAEGPVVDAGANAALAKQFPGEFRD